jgi:hypothetical protein
MLAASPLTGLAGRPMPRSPWPLRPRLLATLLAGTVAIAGGGAQARPFEPPSDDAATAAPDAGTLVALARTLRVGDIVFTRIGAYPFRKVAAATGTWTNHVGIVLDVSGAEPVIGESRFPFSGTTSLGRFVARSAGRRVAVMRLPGALSPDQRRAIGVAAAQREHVFYDTGFDAHSPRQFCSRYVREVLLQAAGVEVGELQTFETLLQTAPPSDIGFWRAWYFGRIPWHRETVTPASLLHSPGLQTVFDGTAT